MPKSRLEDKSIQAWARLLRSHKVLLEKTEQALKRHRLPPLIWYDVLLELHRVGSEGLKQYQISELILLSKHNLTRLLDRMEAQGLVERLSCAHDARSNIIVITEKGEKLRASMWPVYSRAIRENFSEKLSSSDIDSLMKLLKKLLAKQLG